MWQEHFKAILNLGEHDAEIRAKQFVQVLNQCNSESMTSALTQCDVEIVMSQSRKLKRKCASGLDNICTEHLVHSHPLIYVHISLLFNMRPIHGFIPDRCIESMITPVVKSNKNSTRDSQNYQPIALASTFSKLFELILLRNFESYTCDNQFGFKSGHGTDSCVFLLKQTISHYNIHKTPLYAIFVDSSKAFNRVCHYLLLKKFIERQVNCCAVYYVLVSTDKN